MLEGIARLRHQLFNRAFPAAHILKAVRIPCIISDTEQSYLGCIGLLHRVGEETCYIVKIRIQIVERSHNKLAVAVIIYRIVPPYRKISFNACPTLRPLIYLAGNV